MKAIITLAILFITCGLFSQQAPSSVTGGEANIPTSTEPCISEEEHQEILKKVEENINTLINQGRYLSPNRQMDHPLFIVPVAQVDGFEYHNVWAFSNYVDHNTGFPNQIQDYNCGNRTYDTAGGYNHTGYDLFTWPFGWKQMDLNQSVNIAAAAGQIIFKQDGNFDKNCSFNSEPLNGIGLQHSDGSRTFYFHFKNGEITDKEIGDSVTEGEYLGVIGSSGSSTGPHAHFEVFDSENNLIDPSIGACNNLNNDTWWAEPISYTNPGINAVLTHTQFPIFNTCPETETTFENNQFALNDNVAVAVYLKDQIANTTLSLRTLRPDGSIQFEWDFELVDQFQASWWAWNIPADMEGTWTWEATYMNETVSHNFETGVLGLNDNVLNNVTLYPNPTTDGIVSLNFKDIVPEATVTLFNVLGQNIARKQFINQENIELQIKGDAGLYFVTVETINGVKNTFRVIKK